MPIVELVNDEMYLLHVAVEGEGREQVFSVTDENHADPLVFEMKRLNHEAQCELDNNLMVGKGDKTAYKLGDNRKKTMRHCVKGWRNMKASDGSEIPFSWINFNNLPPKLIKLIDDHITDENGLRGDREKN